jgi:3-dehydroquinate synthetase
VVIDERAAAALPGLCAALPAERRMLISAGERTKRLRVVDGLLEAASRHGAERGDAWLAVGGGTTGDLVGTAAALYLRGASLIHVPTTWLAQADSSIGGKVAVDLAAAKNAAGAFWPPVAVVADVATLRTLPRARLLDGLAETLKAGLIGDPWLWGLIEERGAAALDSDEAARFAMVERAIRLKLGVVDRDPFELGERRTLNLGHTIGHALEIESRYRLAHGQAVVLGLRAVLAIAARRGADPVLAERVDSLVRPLGYALTRRFDAALVKAALRTDKKRHRGRQRWILPMAVGRVIEADDVTEAELDLALARILAGARPARRASPPTDGPAGPAGARARPSGSLARPAGARPAGDAARPDGARPAGDAARPDGERPAGDGARPSGSPTRPARPPITRTRR